jgi:hypothetical protein
MFVTEQTVAEALLYKQTVSNGENASRSLLTAQVAKRSGYRNDDCKGMPMIKHLCEPVPHASSPAETAMMMLSSETIMRQLTGCCVEAESDLVGAATALSHSDITGLTIRSPLLEANLAVKESFEISVQDWDCLFHAVLARLETSASMSGAGQSVLCDSKLTLASIVLECVAALEQLHLSLASQRKGRSQAEDAAVLVQDLVTLAVADLVGATYVSLPGSLKSSPRIDLGETR